MNKIKCIIERFYDDRYLLEYEVKPGNLLSSPETKRKICNNSTELIETIKKISEE